jgi:hypothetical protein
LEAIVANHRARNIGSWSGIHGESSLECFDCAEPEVFIQIRDPPSASGFVVIG